MIIGIKNTIPTLKSAPAWLPSNESRLVAWYKFGKGQTLVDGSAPTNGGLVSKWADSSTNTFDMLQATEAERPEYSDGALLFAGSESFTSSSAITTLSAGFVIGIRMDANSANTVILGESTTNSEMIKLHTSSSIRVKPGSSNVDFTMESGHTTKDDSTWIITRDSDDDVEVWKNLDGGGLVQQDTTKSGPGDFILDTVGKRAGGTPNKFVGTVKEIAIFNGIPDNKIEELRNNLLAHLKDL
tara:strand:+ start:6696 stop:7421 length:726 start_codon:yes stop_codon:yes gene_type:complete